MPGGYDGVFVATGKLMVEVILEKSLKALEAEAMLDQSGQLRGPAMEQGAAKPLGAMARHGVGVLSALSSIGDNGLLLVFLPAAKAALNWRWCGAAIELGAPIQWRRWLASRHSRHIIHQGFRGVINSDPLSRRPPDRRTQQSPPTTARARD